MSKNSTNIKDRVLQIADFKENSKQNFFRKSNLKYSNFTGKSKLSDLSSGSLAEILLIYPDVNPEWLLTGKGPMLKESDAKPTSESSGIPLLPYDAFAGIGDTAVDGVNFETIEERYVVPLFDGIKIDFMLPVRGSSMYPKYSSGDVVACRQVDELLFIQWNKVYVIDTHTQGVIMKRLKKSENEDNIICKSDNKEYDPFELPKKEIRNIALVVGVIRLE